MPEFFIHCGLHKTGTTALQQFFAGNAQALLDAGLHYPASGTGAGGGHHNLAWELGRDRRYLRRAGSLELMVRQAAAVGKDTVISSEDFESSLLTPGRWTPLVETLKGLGFSVTFVIYLRDPAKYLQSLFLENIKHHCGDEFGTVARAVLERGSYSYEDWIFQFDYDQVARQMSAIPGARVVFRSFERLVGGSIIPDFFALVGHEVPDGLDRADNQANVQARTVDLLAGFVRNRHFPFMPPDDQLADVVHLMVGGRDIVPVMPGRLAEAIARQRVSKVKQAADEQQAGSLASPRSRSGDWVVNISRLFSWETQVEALAIHHQAPGSGADKIAALRSGDQGVFESWRNWVAAGL